MTNLNFLLFMEVYFVSLSLLVLLVALYYKIYNYNVQSFKKLIGLSIFGLVIYILLLLHCLSFKVALYYDKAFYFTTTSVIIKLIITIILICIFIAMLDYFTSEKYLIMELPFIMFMSVEGMFLLLIANDLFLIFLSMELQSLSLYILAAIKRYSNVSIEAGLKYFILGSFSSGLMLFGISLIYGFTGTTNLYKIHLLMYASSVSNDVSMSLGYILILCAFLFKLGLVPFHNWVADVYEGSPLIITFFFSVVPKLVVFFVFLRVYKYLYITHFVIFDSLFPIYYITWSCALFSIIIGTLGALYQVTIKRLLAYSAISNMGYIILSLHTMCLNGLGSSLYFLFIYIFVSLNMFIILLILRRNNCKIKNIVEFVSVSNSNPFLSILLVCSIFSLAGIPPFIGFFGKLAIFVNLLEKGFYVTAIIAMLASVLICVYYIRLIRFIWFVDNANYPIYNLNSISSTQTYFIAFWSILNIVLLFLQGPLFLYINNLSIFLFLYA